MATQVTDFNQEKGIAYSCFTFFSFGQIAGKTKRELKDQERPGKQLKKKEMIWPSWRTDEIDAMNR